MGSMKKEIKAIIFDYGCVITMNQDERLIYTMCKELNLTHEIFKNSYTKFRPDYDAGSITAEEFWQNICHDCQRVCTKSLVRRLIQLDIKSWTVINKDIREYILGLKKYTIKKAIISNMCKEVLEYINKKISWFTIFDETVYSCNLNTCKPGKPIFYKCLELLRLNPDECLFIDDSYDNCTSAGEIGMHSIHFKDFKQFRSEVENNYTFS